MTDTSGRPAFPDRGLLRLLPDVLRARDFHLYLAGGKRLTDLWLAGGNAVLGHKPPRVLAALKNAGERGLFPPFPHPLGRRFLKALEGFFPPRYALAGKGADGGAAERDASGNSVPRENDGGGGWAFRLYTDGGSLLRALEKAGFTDPGGASVHDPAYGGGPGRVSLWRPFLEDAAGGPGGAQILVPVLPWPLGPAVLVLEKGLETSFPPGDPVPPVLLAPAARALYCLAAALKAPAQDRGIMYPKILAALKKSPWRRRGGIYLTREPGLDGEAYKALFLKFLEGGFLLPPSEQEPLILPGSMSPGEEAKLAALLLL